MLESGKWTHDLCSTYSVPRELDKRYWKVSLNRLRLIDTAYYSRLHTKTYKCYVPDQLNRRVRYTSTPVRPLMSVRQLSQATEVLSQDLDSQPPVLIKRARIIQVLAIPACTAARVRAIIKPGVSDQLLS